MNKHTIRDYIFTLSGYMQLTTEFVKSRIKLLLCIFGINILLMLPSIFYMRYYNQIISEYALSGNIAQGFSQLSGIFAIMFLYGMVMIVVQALIFGVLYSQSRAFVDGCDLDFKDSLSYSVQRLGSYITNALAQFLIFLGITFIFAVIVIVFSLIFSLGSGNGGVGQFLAITLLVLAGLGLYAFMFYLMIRLFFSSHTAENYRCGWFHSVSYSNELTKGFKGKIFGYIMLFLAISLAISFVTSLINTIFTISTIGLSNLDNLTNQNMFVLLFSSITSAALGLFSSIFYNFVFINIDSVKRKYPMPGSQLNMTWEDAFYRFCLDNQIPTGYVPPNESKPMQ